MGLQLFAFEILSQLEHAKDIVILRLYHLHLLLIKLSYSFNPRPPASSPAPAEVEDRPLPPPLMVLPEVYSQVQEVESSMTIKNQLPVMSYSEFLMQLQITDHEEAANHEDNEEVESNDSVCMVCMDCLETEDEVRVPSNCCHVFHSKCLDGWIGEGHKTCPLCRSNMLPAGEDDHQQDNVIIGSLWRMEEMLYLYGHTFLMAH